MHIEFRHLRTVRAIHEAGGLARAAEQLNITQSALSHQIKGLEDQEHLGHPEDKAPLSLAQVAKSSLATMRFMAPYLRRLVYYKVCSFFILETMSSVAHCILTLGI